MWLASLAVVAGCVTTGDKKEDAAATKVTSTEPATASPAPAPVVTPPPPARPSAAEVDARIKLLARLRRFHEAAQYYDTNGDLIAKDKETTALLRQIAEGLNKQYEAPLQEAATSLARYQQQRPPPDQLPRAKEAIAAARETLNEYEAVRLLQELKAASPQARRLQQALERAQGQVAGAEAALNAPDPKLQKLVAEGKLAEAGALFRENAKTFLAAKPPGKGLAAFAKAQASASDARLTEATQQLRSHANANPDAAVWAATSSAFAGARKAIQDVKSLPPFEVADLQPPKLRALETALKAAEAAWAAKAGEAFLGYGHGGAEPFSAAYPVKVTPAQLSEKWPAQAEARLAAKAPAQLRALQTALGNEAPQKSRDLVARALAKSERAAAPPPTAVAKAGPASAPTPSPQKTAGGQAPSASPIRPAVMFVDSDK
jgi:hypothetical protein